MGVDESAKFHGLPGSCKFNAVPGPYMSLYILSLMSLSSSSRRSNKLLYNIPELCAIPNKVVLLSLHGEQHKHAALHGIIEIVNYFLNKCILKVSTSFLLCVPWGSDTMSLLIDSDKGRHQERIVETG